MENLDELIREYFQINSLGLLNNVKHSEERALIILDSVLTNAMGKNGKQHYVIILSFVL